VRGEMRRALGAPGAEELRRVLTEKLSTVAQLALLTPREWAAGGAPDPAGRGALLVVNTHLFYHPMAGHIRMLQACAPPLPSSPRGAAACCLPSLSARE
jgi:hypothetical protein